MSQSIFLDKALQPKDEEVRNVLKNSYENWNAIREFITGNHENVSDEWNFPGKNYGWSMRIKIKKRNIIYMVPHDGYFNVAFVFGPRAYEVVSNSDLPGEIKDSLKQARVYMEGRGIRLDVHADDSINNIQELIQIKVQN